jgi:hypothetical protein
MATLVENILRKAVEEGFVRYEDGNFYDRNDDIILVNQDPVSPGSGSNLIPFIAYASSPDGAGFTLTSSDTLEYIAFKIAASDAVLVAADFAGLWFHRKGLPGSGGTGVDGIDGRQAGFPVVFLSDTGATKPALQGGVKFNHASLASATVMYIDELSPAGDDRSALINTLTPGTLFTLNIDSPTGTTTATFEFSGAVTDNTDWFSIPVINRLVSASTFSDGDACTFQISGTNNSFFNAATGEIESPKGTPVSGTYTAATLDALKAAKPAATNADYNAVVQDAGGLTNPLLDPRAIAMNSDGANWNPLNGTGLLGIMTASIIVTAPASTFTGPYTLTSAGGGARTKVAGGGAHGLTSALAVTGQRKIYVSAGNGTVGLWTVKVIAVDTSGTDFEIDLPYNAANTITSIALANDTDVIRMLDIEYPDLRSNSTIICTVDMQCTNSANIKRQYVDLRAAGDEPNGTMFCNASMVSALGLRRETVITNKHATNIQHSKASSTSPTTGGNYAAMVTGSIQTNAGCVVGVGAKFAAANEYVELIQVYPQVIL